MVFLPLEFVGNGTFTFEICQKWYFYIRNLSEMTFLHPKIIRNGTFAFGISQKRHFHIKIQSKMTFLHPNPIKNILLHHKLIKIIHFTSKCNQNYPFYISKSNQKHNFNPIFDQKIQKSSPYIQFQQKHRKSNLLQQPKNSSLLDLLTFKPFGKVTQSLPSLLV
jgi:hypothetical protein